ncbi:MAG: hypothetical protein NTX57_05640 [Armatimonadetes bacterium]|nr:hypothetical protein [Armatimonadota bacterium]
MYSGQDQQPPQYTPPAQRVRFEDIGVAFQLLQKQLGAWVGAGAIATFSIAAVVIPFYVMLIAGLMRQGERINPATLIGPGILMFVGLIALSTIITSGMYQMALKQLRGQTLSLGDMFANINKAGPVLGLLLLLGLVGGLVGGVLGAILSPILGPFTSIVTSLPSYIAGALSSLSVLLVLDQNMSPVDAIKESWTKLKSEIWIALAFILVASMASSIGSLACGIGMIFTLPLYYLCMALMYRNFYPERFESGGGQ